MESRLARLEDAQQSLGRQMRWQMAMTLTFGMLGLALSVLRLLWPVAQPVSMQTGGHPDVRHVFAQPKC